MRNWQTKTKTWIIISVVCLNFSTNGTSYGQDSQAPAIQKEGSVYLKAGTSVNLDLLCYTGEAHEMLLADYAEGNECMKIMAQRIESQALTTSRAWYDSKVLWLGLGVVLGAGAYGISR